MATIISTPEVTAAGYTSYAICAGNTIRFTLLQNSASATPRYFSVAIYKPDGTTLIAELTTPIEYPVPGEVASTFIDAFLRRYLNSKRPDIYSAEDGGLISGVRTSDKSAPVSWLALPFRFAYKEEGDSAYTVEAGTYIALSGVAQISKLYGGNMYQYIAKVSSGPVVDTAGKFLTTFLRPTLWHWEGLVFLPFLAFIVQEDLEGGYVVGQSFDGGTPTYSYLSIDAGAGFATFFDSVQADFVADVQSATTAELTVYTGTPSPATPDQLAITEIVFDVREACQNPAFVMWKDAYGSFHVWAFEKRVNEGYEFDTPDPYTVFTPPFGQTGDAYGDFAVPADLQKLAVRTLEVFAIDLTDGEWEALAGMLGSPAVYLNVNEAGDSLADRWVQVRVSGRPIRNRFNARHKFTMNIEVPHYTQPN